MSAEAQAPSPREAGGGLGWGVALAAALLLALAGAWNHDLWVYDEPREAELARAMWRSGNWLYTVLNEQPFLEKPPLFTWTVASAFAVVGHPSIVAARVVAALWSFATLTLVAWFASRIVSGRAALTAALLLATTNRFHTCSQTILLDNALCAFTTGGLVFGWVALAERRAIFALLAALCVGGAFMVKGVVGVGIVGLVLALETIAVRAPSPREAGGGLGWGAAFAVFALLPAVAYGLVLRSRSGDLFHELYWNNQFGRFFHGYGSKPTSWHFYFRTWWENFVPWTPLAFVALVKPPRHKATRFLLLWAMAPMVALSFSQARARYYMVPLVPAYALLMTLVWEEVSLTPLLVKCLRGLWVVAALSVAVTGGVILAWGGLDVLVVVALLLALGSLAFLRDGRKETLALGLLLVASGGWILRSTAYVTAWRERAEGLSYHEVSRQVWQQVGSRRLVLFHANDSYSGTFAFMRDTSVLGFDEVADPHGEKLVATVTSRDAVLAPVGRDGKGALDLLPPERRREFEVEWASGHEGGEKTAFALYRRTGGPP